MPCFACPSADSNCSVVVAEVLTASNIAQDQNSTLGEWSIWDEAQSYCEALCELKNKGESCSQDSQCTPGALFCDYAANDTEYTDGKCKNCPTNPDDCFKEGFSTSVQGQHNCRDCRLFCNGVGVSKVWIDGVPILSQPIDSATQTSRTTVFGPLYDCSNLILDPKTTCAGADGKICLIEFKQQFAIPWQVSNQAEQSGCAGIIAFIDHYDSPMYHSNSELLIPYVYIPIEEGRKLLKNKIGATAKIKVEIFGAGCWPGWDSNMCSLSWPCDGGNFCEYNSVPIEHENHLEESVLYSEGYCRPCPENPVACYFDFRNDGLTDAIDNLSTKTVQKVQSCAASCGANLINAGCKFCTSQVTGFEFGVGDEEDQCILCPQYDMQYPDRIIPLFGDNVTCWQVESFFKRLPVPKDSTNCQIAQSMNFICGCDGTGYAGANTQMKRAVLAWLPRAAAILSIMGSSLIIYDTNRTRRKQAKLINKVLCTISVFDAIGSLAMTFTTLPMPKADFIYGSKGNEATCTAQGFFIQMGTISCLLGTSLALYYNLTIKHGWSESKLKRKRIIYFLLIPPFITGFTFAGAGIPYYDNVLVWCNNSAKWWPELPVILAILLSTIVMGDTVSSVYKKESASSRYSGGGNKLSKMVFKQAMWFVAAFYITWVPYLVLQYMWSSGKGYNIYGLTLAAATLVPLQGFWNCFVYCRPRYFKNFKSVPVMSRIVLMINTMRMSRRSTEKDSHHIIDGVATQATLVRTSVSASSVKSSGANTSSVTMESEVVPVGAVDPDKPVAPDSYEPEVVRFEAPETNDGSESDDHNSDNHIHNADDNLPVTEGKEGDNEDDKGNERDSEEDQDARFEMMLAG
ncbi:hypothetical protein ACHAW6_013868 [Cyclotella cf. meneghiniana]